jgi:hypothetical protein
MDYCQGQRSILDTSAKLKSFPPSARSVREVGHDTMNDRDSTLETPVSDPSFSAYGDESSFERVVTYGIVALPTGAVPVVAALSDLKRSSGVPPTEPFHARIIFSGDARRKTGWAHLEPPAILAFADKFVHCLRQHDALFSIGAVHRDEYPADIPAGAGFPAGVMEPKQLTATVFLGAVLHLQGLVRLGTLRLQIDPDPTRIDWFGKKMRADRNYVLEPAAGAALWGMQVQLATVNKPVLLEAADLLAYTASHALADKEYPSKQWFEDIYAQCRPLLSTLTYDPEARARDEVAHSILEQRHAAICRSAPGSTGGFHHLPVGVCTWMLGYDGKGDAYPCLLLRLPKGSASKALAPNLPVDIRAAIIPLGRAAVVAILLRLPGNDTIFISLLDHLADTEVSPLTLLSDGAEIRLFLFEDAPRPVGVLPLPNSQPAFWQRLRAMVEALPPYTHEEFVAAVEQLPYSPQQLWDSL